MADLVCMTKTAWKALLDSIRAKGGTTALMTAAQAKNAVDAIETGGGSSIPDFTLVGTQTITDPVSQLTFTIPIGATQLMIVVSDTIIASRKSYFYWYFNNSVMFYYNVNATSMAPRTAIYGKMTETGGQPDISGITIAGVSTGTLSNVNARDLSVGGTLKLTGYYSDSQLTGGTVSVYWR